ncbi:hypothetical protein QFZ40_004026 [Arthrobacter pascens]|uniref:DUF6492 family protein n=1 Tax=Arthrobacter pascens TaxID=1677 RepID=UPI002789961F|nr:DUF6492 family protein [Arthrobacter pascens]MDQ0636117.1 hypothetical protein [Arthrobacter pascens]
MSSSPHTPKSIALITPSYGPDLELCRDLRDSVLRFTSTSVEHFIIVPRADRSAFSDLSGHRTFVREVDEFLPKSMMKMPKVNVWLNIRWPIPPIRGWIAQQIVKLAAAASMTTDVVLLIDSDVILIRPVDAESFSPLGQVQLFEAIGAIDGTLPRHRLWHAAARRLLGLPRLEADLLPDYVCWPCAWEPSVVRQMLGRVESSTGLPWQTALARELHFSEMILYGVFVREILGVSMPLTLTSSMRCVNHFDETALTRESMKALLRSVGRTDFAVMVSAKSETPLDLRRELFREFCPPA